MRNVLVLGLAHSGASQVTRLVCNHGWHMGTVNEKNEHVQVVDCNNKILDGQVDIASMILSLAAIPKPCVIKDPRFIHTYDRWVELLSDYVMVYVDRDEIDIWRIHHKHAKYMSVSIIKRDSESALKNYYRHSGPKMMVNGNMIYNPEAADVFGRSLMELVTA